jgi:anti-sigma B factor antagonist
LKIKRKPEDGVMVLQLNGKIMGGPDHELFTTEVKSCIADGYVDIVLDFGKINYVNSTGLGLLISGYTTLKKENGRMKICNLTERVESIMVVTALDSVFEIYKTDGEALASFGETASE